MIKGKRLLPTPRLRIDFVFRRKNHIRCPECLPLDMTDLAAEIPASGCDYPAALKHHTFYLHGICGCDRPIFYDHWGLYAALLRTARASDHCEGSPTYTTRNPVMTACATRTMAYHTCSMNQLQLPMKVALPTDSCGNSHVIKSSLPCPKSVWLPQRIR